MTGHEATEGGSIRLRDVVLAGHRGDQDLARRALDAPEAAVRAAAVGALDRLGALRPDELRAALADPQPSVRRRAAEIAVRHPSVSLASALSDRDHTVVEVAAWAVGERPPAPESDLRALIELARGHPEPLVREAAVAALGALGDERGLPAILAGCADKPAVRRRAVLALAPFDGPEVDAALDAALGDRDWQVRQAAEDLVRAVDQSSA